MQRPLARVVAPTRIELVPWTDRKGRLHPLRATTFGLLLLPAAWLLLRWALGWLGPERINAAIHSTGYWTIWLLLASLAVTPLKVLGGVANVVVVRRMVGNAALIYAALHLCLYATDQHWRLVTIAAEIVKRFYLTIGFIALLGLLVLGFTSTDGWARWLGKAWKTLHRVVYAIVVLGLVHYILQSKLDVSQALVAGGVFTWLMLWRALPAGPDRHWPALLGVTLLSALLTLGFEYAWYRFGTHINPIKVLLSELDIGFGLRPAGQVLLLGLVATALVEVRRLGTTAMGGTVLFTMALYALGAVVDDVAAFALGWSYDDVLPDDMSPLIVDAAWAAILALLGLARWQMRQHWLRRFFDAIWVLCVLSQCLLVGIGSRVLGVLLLTAILGAAAILLSRVWTVSRGAAMLLLPLSLFLVYRAVTLL